MKTEIRKDILDANILVHSRMADTYNSNEPHYRPENRAKVRKRLEALRASSGPRLLDVGCGTGFVIDLAKDLFAEIDGVDITQPMLDRVDRTGGVIRLHNAPAQHLPFADATFDAVSAYAFLHHLEDYRPVLGEMARVLKPGGRAYVDLEPNRLFWKAMTELEAAPADVRASYSDIVQREINSVLHTDDRVQEEFGIEADTFNLAEFTKSILGGIDPWDFRRDAIANGFSRCEVHPEWFLGQGTVMHTQSFADADTIDVFLRRVSPLSTNLYKYLRFDLVK